MQLQFLTEKLPENRFAALVTKVDDQQTQIYAGADGVIPFTCSWAYPPRRADGNRPPKITSLKQALTADDIVIVQRPVEAPDLINDDIVHGRDVFALGQRPLVEGAIVVLDPHTGRLLALTGGYDYRVSEFNRATQAKRQPGSAFKPFVYLAALDRAMRQQPGFLMRLWLLIKGQASQNGSLQTIQSALWPFDHAGWYRKITEFDDCAFGDGCRHAYCSGLCKRFGINKICLLFVYVMVLVRQHS